MTLNPEVSVGDILTSLSIIISAIALAISWGRDRQIAVKKQADKVRNAASKTLAKLERWQELSLRLYEDVQPLFVEASEMLAKDPNNAEPPRDFLWKKLEEVRQSATLRIVDEELEVAYVDLYGYIPAIYQSFVQTVQKLKEEDETAFRDLQEATQKNVMSFADRGRGFQTAELGNSLRRTCAQIQDSLQTAMQDTLKPIHEFLLSVILKSDNDILRYSPPKSALRNGTQGVGL